MDKNFVTALKALPPKIRAGLHYLPETLQAITCEISLRAMRPLSIQTLDGAYFLSDKFIPLKKFDTQPLYIVTADEVTETVKIITQYSIHSFKDEINQGFVTIECGHRVGICGTGIFDKNEIIGVKNIASLNIRIAREKIGISHRFFSRLNIKSPMSVLISGAPATGKTTLIRDICRAYSNGYGEISPQKVSLIDERGEIAASKFGIAQNEIGALTDVFDGYKKSVAMEIALRCMSPKIIIVDEIGTLDDKNAILNSANAGVCVIATAHASNINELLNKPQMNNIIRANVFEKIVFLKNSGTPCEIAEVVNCGDL